MIADLLRGKFDAADLSAIDAEIARLTALRELVAGAIGPAAPAPEPVAGKTPPAAPTAAPRAKGVPSRAPADRDRRALVALHLYEHGPQPWGVLSETFGIPPGSRRGVFDHPWFTKAEGRGSPYELTAAGRAAVEAAREKPPILTPGVPST